SWPYDDVARARHRFARFDRAAVGDPGREAAVQHGDVVMPGPAQGPPQPGGRLPVPAVIDDDRMPGPYADRAQCRLQRVRVGQWVAARGPGRTAEFAIKIEEGGAGNVPVDVLRPAGRTAQTPPDVDDRWWIGRRERPGKGGNVHERHAHSESPPP